MKKERFVDRIRRLGKAVEDGKMSMKDAATELALSQEGGLTLKGAEEALRNWKNDGQNPYGPEAGRS